MTKEIKMEIQGSEGGKILAVPPSLGIPVAPDNKGDRDGNSRK
jgi:hypothetical protein